MTTPPPKKICTKCPYKFDCWVDSALYQRLLKSYMVLLYSCFPGFDPLNCIRPLIFINTTTFSVPGIRTWDVSVINLKSGALARSAVQPLKVF